MTLIDTNKLIAPDAIKKGDEIRKHYLEGEVDDHRVKDYIAEHDGDSFESKLATQLFELIKRPRPIIHAKGTTLWFADLPQCADELIGREVTVTEDFRKGDLFVSVEAACVAGGWPAHRFSTTPPAPAAVIPEVPTLGVAVFEGRHIVKGVWHVRNGRLSGVRFDGYSSDCFILEKVTAFTPLHVLADDETAVKTAAVEGLREYADGLHRDIRTPAVRRIDKFLATIDSAGEPS